MSNDLLEGLLSTDQSVLILLGANYNKFVLQGEYYRLLTNMFLHGGLLHIALNMYALYSIGPLVERIYGRIRYAVIYFISGIIASVFSCIFSQGVSVGASGAIFGLLGTTLVFAIKMRENIGRGFLRNIASVIIINLFIGFSLPNIDNYAHLGGLIGGTIAAILLYKIRKDK
jgi:rhomboid protease GluP